ncbi:hypothetical protein ACYULU_07710 [Breznakiellaceae bacterium SP9]
MKKLVEAWVAFAQRDVITAEEVLDKHCGHFSLPAGNRKVF